MRVSQPPARLTIRWEARALKEAQGLPHDVRLMVLKAVESLREDPLKGDLLSAAWKGIRRLRVGAYRILYAFDGRELLVLILRVCHRREVYRK
jgi:mRNA interferase RelE/StbE